MENAYNTIHNIYHINVPNIYSTNPHKLNKTIIAAHSSHEEICMASFVAKRLRWWLKVDESSDLVDEGLAQVVIDNLRHCCKALPHHVVCSFLKTLANAWVTSSRLGACPSECVFGCGCSDGDNITHMIACPLFRKLPDSTCLMAVLSGLFVVKLLRCCVWTRQTPAQC